MYLETSKAKNKEGYYARVMMSYRLGKKVKKRCVKYLGYLSKEELEVKKEVVELANELVEAEKQIEEEIEEEKQDLNEGEASSLNLGCLFLKYGLAFYKMKEVFEYYQKRHKGLTYQVYQDFFFLVYAAVLDPDSIEGELSHQERYFDCFGLKLWDTYRSLDRINELSDKIRWRCAKISLENFTDSLGVFYIDGTNVYVFSRGDPYEVDSDEGLRRFGKSKEERSLPLIGITFLMSHSAFPIYFDVFPGNRNDATQLINNARKLESLVGNRRFLLCGDAGYSSGSNRFFLSGRNLAQDTNNAYLFPKTISGQALREWILSPDGWKSNLGISIRPDQLDCYIGPRYKERIISREDEVMTHDGKKKLSVNVNLKQIAFYSPKLRRKKQYTMEHKEKRLWAWRETSKKPRNLSKNTPTPT